MRFTALNKHTPHRTLTGAGASGCSSATGAGFLLAPPTGHRSTGAASSCSSTAGCTATSATGILLGRPTGRRTTGAASSCTSTSATGILLGRPTGRRTTGAASSCTSTAGCTSGYLQVLQQLDADFVEQDDQLVYSDQQLALLH